MNKAFSTPDIAAERMRWQEDLEIEKIRTIHRGRTPQEGPGKDTVMPKELQPHTAVPAWDSMSPGEKQSWLLTQALDCKTGNPDPADAGPL
jgi:hypothetical protein